MDRQSQATYPPSPCNKVCTLDDRDVCLGCGRTLDQIMRWTQMTPAEQRAVIDTLPQRKTRR